MPTITKESLQALAKNRPAEDFPIPGSTDTARLRKVSIAEYRAITQKAKGADDLASAVEFLAVCWVDENNEPLFGSDRKLLEDLPAEMLIPLFTKGIDYSGLGQKATEAAEKNS